MTQPVDAPVGTPVTDEIASAKRDIDLFAGWLKALPNPDTILREQPGRAIRIYRDMQRDSHIRSVVGTRRLAVIGKDWDIQPASDDSADQTVRDLVVEALEGIRGFERARDALLDGVWTGFAIGEVMWGVKKLAAGSGQQAAIVPIEIKRRGQHRFVFDVEGRPRLLTLANLFEGEELPQRKFLLFQYEADPENPYGVGIGQSCYWPWWFKKHGIKFWVVFMERFGMPFPLGKYPPGTSAEQQDALLDVLKSFTTDTAAKIPSTMTVEFLEAQRGSTVAVYDPFIRTMNDEISKAVLGQTATVSGTPGSLGNESARAEVREDIVEADADLLDEVITTQLIRWIVDFNFGPDVPAPWFTTKTDPAEDLSVLAVRDKTLVDMGARIPARYVYDTYGIPEPEGDEAVLERAAAVSWQPAGGSGQGGPMGGPGGPMGLMGPMGRMGPMGPEGTEGGFGEAARLDRILAETERALAAVVGATDHAEGVERILERDEASGLITRTITRPLPRGTGIDPEGINRMGRARARGGE